MSPLGLVAARAAVRKRFTRVPIGEVRASWAETAAVRTSLGRDVDLAVSLSPKLSRMLLSLQMDGWSLECGVKGTGARCDPMNRKILIDPDKQASMEQILSALAYEAAYAHQQDEPYVPPRGLTKARYVAANVARKLKVEAERILSFLEIKQEMEREGGWSIVAPGLQVLEYKPIVNKYPRMRDRDSILGEMMTLLAGNKPSGAEVSYRDYYSQAYAYFFDIMPQLEDSVSNE